MREDFERLALKRLSYYFGKTQTELKQTFSVDSSAKNINEVLLSKMLGIDGKLASSPELKDSNITPKTIRIQKTGHIKESMSFPTFRFQEIIKQDWEDSDFYHVLKDSLFMFVIFDENNAGDYVFKRVKFWRMSEKDLLEAKKVWERTVQIIRDGVKLEYDGRITRNNLPGSSESPVAHVRPHAKNSQDTYPLPDGRTMTKQCFWLNREYIENIVKDVAEKEGYSQDRFNADEASFISSLLTSNLVFIEDLEKKYIERFGNEHVGRVNARSLRALGYKYYSDYVISTDYSTSDDYFRQLILDAPVLDLSNLDPRLIQSLSFNKVLDTLRANYDVLEFEEGRYITFDHLKSSEPEITKDTLIRFTSEAMRNIGDDDFINSHHLRKIGFESKLYDFGFSDFFYDRLIRYSNLLKFMRIGGTLLFYKGVIGRTNGDFMRYLLKDKRSMDIDKFEEYLVSEYGVKFSRNRIITTAKTSGLYYDTTMEKVYYSKDDFYDDL